jgi:hypothetical protein
MASVGAPSFDDGATAAGLVAAGGCACVVGAGAGAGGEIGAVGGGCAGFCPGRGNGWGVCAETATPSPTTAIKITTSFTGLLWTCHIFSDYVKVKQVLSMKNFRVT